MRKNLFSAAGLSIAIAATSLAAAQSGDAAAQVLFDEGKALLGQGKYAEACAKFADSHRLSPNGGTLSNLAECLEVRGHLASAWLRYKELAARANAANQAAAEKSALEHVASLESRLLRLRIEVSTPNIPGLEILRDGVVVAQPEWGLPVPIDPGVHKIEARAPHHVAFTKDVNINSGNREISITVPALVPEDGQAAATTEAPTGTIEHSTPEIEQPSNTRRTLGLIVAGVGVVGLGVGGAFGFIAKSKNDEALEPQNCPATDACRPTGLTLTDEAQNAATISTVAFIAGGVLLVAGGVLFLTAPSKRAASWHRPGVWQF